MICELDNLQTIIKKEKINIAVVCYGGCCSNTLVDVLDQM